MTKQRLNYAKLQPETYAKMLEYYTAAKNAGIDEKLRHLIFLRVSQINHCAYCIDLHSEEGRKAGIAERKMHALSAWRESGFFDDKERAALQWTEDVTFISESHAPDSSYEELQKYFDQKEIAALTFLISCMNGMNRMAATFRVQPNN